MGICVPCCAFVNTKWVPLQDSSHWNAFIYSVFSHQKAHKLLTGLHWSLEPGSHAETSACVTSTGLLWTQLCFSQIVFNTCRRLLLHFGNPEGSAGTALTGVCFAPSPADVLPHARTYMSVCMEWDGSLFFFWGQIPIWDANGMLMLPRQYSCQLKLRLAVAFYSSPLQNHARRALLYGVRTHGLCQPVKFAHIWLSHPQTLAAMEMEVWSSEERVGC